GSGWGAEVWKGGGRGEAGNEGRSPVGHPRTHPPDEGELVDGNGGDLVGERLLDLVQHGLALLAVELARLPHVEIVDLGQAAVGVDPLLRRVRFEPRGRVAEGGGDDE